MSDHEFVLKLQTAGDVEPQVRMWIDDQQTRDLASEQEVTLVRDGTGTAAWSAAFNAQGPFTYRIGIVAAPGSHWAFEFRTSGDESEELLYDADELTMTKEWLIGSCEAIRQSHAWRRKAS